MHSRTLTNRTLSEFVKLHKLAGGLILSVPLCHLSFLFFVSVSVPVCLKRLSLCIRRREEWVASGIHANMLGQAKQQGVAHSPQNLFDLTATFNAVQWSSSLYTCFLFYFFRSESALEREREGCQACTTHLRKGFSGFPYEKKS